MKNTIKLILLAMMTLTSLDASAERVKDLASILGVRENQLIGYGLVVGLDGSGDTTPYTENSTLSMMTELGVKLPPGTKLNMKNVAAVTVTASLPAFARPGQTIDITVSSFGNAKSLRGGTLLMTPLKGADGQVYAMGQGSLLVASAGESKAAVNHLIVGRIPSGATVERLVPTAVGQGEFIYLELNANDFTTAARLADVVNRDISPDKEIAVAQDGRTIQIKVPVGNARVAFISRIENLQVNAAQPVARVIINARTGSVVMNQMVKLDECAVAHGTLTVVVNGEAVGDVGAESNDGTKPNVDSRGRKSLLHLKRGIALGDVVSALNAIGATPQDMLAILQAMKSAGALRAELEII
ncbi:MAG: flagellar basal body P-ring protein FlgI [Gallionellaceae bacterium]|nr:flagellar basal body P-ring protein FlgI [Gallionellaceae bacterium]